MPLNLKLIEDPMPDLLSGLSFTRLTDAIEVGLEAVKGDRLNRPSKFLAALHAEGFDVVELACGPVKAKIELDQTEGA